MRKSLYPQLALLLELMDITAPGVEVSWPEFFWEQPAGRSAASDGSQAFVVFVAALLVWFPRLGVLEVFVIITFSLGLVVGRGLTVVLGVLVRAILSNCFTLSLTLAGWVSLANSLQWFTIIDLLGFTGGLSVGRDPNTDLAGLSRAGRLWLSPASQSSRISGKLFPKLCESRMLLSSRVSLWSL